MRYEGYIEIMLDVIFGLCWMHYCQITLLFLASHRI